MVATIATSSTVHVPVERIRVGNNPRKRFEEESIAGLAQSIKSRGQPDHKDIAII
jgi:ParB-like chromosome segregation protein Spo0J